jgi:hypothetical protein
MVSSSSLIEEEMDSHPSSCNFHFAIIYSSEIKLYVQEQTKTELSARQ